MSHPRTWPDPGDTGVWHGHKRAISTRVPAWTAGLSAVLVVAVSLVVPEYWGQPWAALWPPVIAAFSPSVLALLRELAGLRAITVNDVAVMDAPRYGRPRRVMLREIRRVRRDLLTGGIVLDDGHDRVRIPPELLDDARQAIVAHGATVDRVSDATGFLARAHRS